MRGNSDFIVELEILILFVVISGAITASGKVIYVDDSAIGVNNGTSWADAYNYLQDALADANMAPNPVEIRVAQGIYTPDQGASVTRGNPGAIFQLINGVAVFGGFAGVGATDPDARYIGAFETILSGDLAGDDAPVDDPYELSGNPTRAENSFCIVSGNGTDRTAVFDGFTVTAAESGVRITNGNPTVDNCAFTNMSLGLLIHDGSQIVTDCTFKNIWFQSIHQFGGSLKLINCLFTGNSGWIESYSDSDLTLSNCTFIDNVTHVRAGINSFGESIRLYNCEFKNNIVGNVVYYSAFGGGEFIVENCTFSGNIGDAIDNYCEYLVISNCIFSGNIGNAINHNGNQLVVSNCVFAGNRGGGWGGGIYSRSRNTNIRNCTFGSNSSERDGSALNLRNGGWVSNCIFWDNDQPAVDAREDELYMRYCNYQGSWSGEGNIDVDPCFVMSGYWDPNGTPDDTNNDFWVDGDYHLQSQAGHWDEKSEAWVRDEETSPCIDAGDPNSPIGTEPFPNGGRLNMGAYGSIDKASKSYFGESVCETIIAGDINGDCVVNFEDIMILISHWMMKPEDLVNKPPTVRLIEPNDGDRIAWRGPTTLIAEANDPDGYVKKVIFYMQYRSDNYTRTRSSDDSDGSDGWECEITWPVNAELGEWIIYAEATDNEGLVGVTPEIKVTLYRP